MKRSLLARENWTVQEMSEVRFGRHFIAKQSDHESTKFSQALGMHHGFTEQCRDLDQRKIRNCGMKIKKKKQIRLTMLLLGPDHNWDCLYL